MIQPKYPWVEVKGDLFKGAARCWSHKLVPLVVMRSISNTENLEDKWIHVSVSRQDRLPTWEELSKVKNEFIGHHLEAYQILPKTSEHVNLHKFCLHLWSPFNGMRRVCNLSELINEVAI